MNPSRKPSTPRVILSLSLSLEELAAIDRAAEQMGTTRSGLIREEALRGTRRILRKLDGESLAA